MIGTEIATDLASAVRDAVGSVIDPELRRSLGELDMIRLVALDGSQATVGVALTIAGCPMAARIERDVRTAALAVRGVESVRVDIGVMTDDERTALITRLRGGRERASIPFTPSSLTRVIAVSSGKGGVGKSTVTANLAAAAAAQGHRVGVLDADVHGFSIPSLLGLIDENGHVQRPTRVSNLVIPPIAHDIRVVSIGMFMPVGAEDTAVSWRGPLLHRTLEQFLTEVYFGDLDFLFVDLPPGTGDVAISLGQLLPHAEVLVVTTPQSAAADVAVRSGLLARQLGQEVRGIIETMAVDANGYAPFGSGGGAAVAARLSTAEHDVPLLGSIPFSITLRESGDAGLPAVVAAPHDPSAVAFTALMKMLAVRPRGLAGLHLNITPS